MYNWSNVIFHQSKMFRAIKMNHVVSMPSTKINGVPLNLMPNISGIYIERLPPNTVSSIGCDNSVFHDNNLDELPWYVNSSQTNHLLVTKGTRKLELFCNYQKKKEEFILNSDTVYRNGNLYHEGSCIISWTGSVFHRTTSGMKGCDTINFTSISNNIYEVNEETGELKELKKEEFLYQQYL